MAMGNIRLRRLQADFERMSELRENSDLITFKVKGSPPDEYVVIYACRGLIWNEAAQSPAVCQHFEVEISLHGEYPRKRPGLRMLTPIFHPNFVNGGICTGSWTPATSLDHLCLQIGRMIQYRNYQLEDCLDQRARDWAPGA